ncbi:hypothetical protein [Actinopolymorpha alba]|uniref:hypothetical protein n=1 Tax=Actinopolymorpha alba TaxID=533267 RepID=UPI00036CC865|nr:hypothetical protein [Actinopolymorpha alba]
MKSRKRIAAAITSLALTAVGMVATAGPAAAGYENNYGKAGTPDPALVGARDCVESYRAKVCFQEYGDKLWVKDIRRDGYTPYMSWKVGDRWGECYNNYGYGKWAVCDKNFTENMAIKFAASSYNFTTKKQGAVSDTKSLRT